MAKHNRTRTYAYGSPDSVGHFIRTELGLTQDDLARLLGVSRVALAKDEGNRRLLPLDVTRQLLDLSRLLHTLAPEPPPPLPPPDAAQREALEMRLQALRIAEHPVRQNLEKQRRRLAQLRRRQQAGSAIAALLPAGAARQQGALDILLDEAEGYLALDATALLLPELRLRVLAFERAEIEKLLSPVPPEPTATGG